MEQLSRDVRITAIYEGTTAIQGLDLITRKILADKRQQMDTVVSEIQNFCVEATGITPLIQQYQDFLNLWLATTEQLLAKSQADANEANAAAVDYLMMSGYLMMGYYLLRSASAAQKSLTEEGDSDGYLQSKLDNATFYVRKILPRVHGLQATIAAGADCYQDLSGEDFQLDINEL